MGLIEGDLVRLNTQGYSDFDGDIGVILKIDKPWYVISGVDYVCKVFFPNNDDIRYYNMGNLEKLT